jgi:hypothetical protein
MADSSEAGTSPQEHLANKTILVNWFLVLAFGDFRPHLCVAQRKFFKKSR